MAERETKKTVRTLAFASFFNDLGSDMIYPVWPLFLTTVLGANMAVLGLIDGLGDALVSISQALSGYISDRIRKRKVFVWLGYIFAVLSRIGYALSTTWQHIIPFKILDRAGKIRSAPRDAIIADISTRENRGTHFGYRKMMDNLGAVCGIITCIILFRLLGYRNLFLIAAIPSVISAFLIFFFIKEKKGSTKVYEGFSFKDLDKNFKLLLFVSAVFALGSFSYSFLLIYANKFGFQITFVPVLYLVFTAIASLSSLPFGKLSDKMGRKPFLMFSFLMWGLVCLSIIFTQSHLAILLAFALYGLHKGALDTVQRTYVSELCPVEFRASSLGTFQMVIGFCALPASLIAGVLWESVNILAPFYFSFALTIISMILLVFVKEPCLHDFSFRH